MERMGGFKEGWNNGWKGWQKGRERKDGTRAGLGEGKIG